MLAAGLGFLSVVSGPRATMTTMLQIRPDQLSALYRPGVQRFEDLMLADVRRFFPELLDASGEVRIRASIQRGIETGEELGYTNRPDVAQFVLLALQLGVAFARDPRIEEIGTFLRDQDDYSIGRRERLAATYEKAVAWLDRTAGVDDEDLVAALLSLREACQRARSAPTPPRDRLEVLVRRLYPSAFDAIGAAGTGALIAAARSSAIAYHVDETGLVPFVGCALILGVEFHCDPQFPWADGVFTPDAIKRTDSTTLPFLDHCETYLAARLAP